MKLIDIVVDELPKRGGWPGAIPVLVQNSSGYVYQAGGGEYIYRLELADDWMDAEVTCEKYFAALRALKPVWDGNGFPPVGCECEIKRVADWMPVTIKFISDHHVVFTTFGGTEDCYQTCSLQFRPIRSEADKKRDAAVSELAKIIGGPGGPYAEVKAAKIYDAIKSGDIVIE